jgi:hypothetical protein
MSERVIADYFTPHIVYQYETDATSNDPVWFRHEEPEEKSR